MSENRHLLEPWSHEVILLTPPEPQSHGAKKDKDMNIFFIQKANVSQQYNEDKPKWIDYAQIILSFMSFLVSLLMYVWH